MWAGGARAVVLDGLSRVLMVRQSHEGKDIWMVPGGAIEEGENAAEAAVREVKEETGLDVTIKSLLWHAEEVSEKRGQRFVNFFLAEPAGGALALGRDPERDIDGQALMEARFMTREEIRALETVYPEYLKDELWDVLAKCEDKWDSFKIRRVFL